MDKTPLYQQIAEAIRQEIMQGALRAGDALPSVRDMAVQWRCTPGTVQQAYRELAGQGLLVSRPGQGTRVGTTLPEANEDRAPIRRATLIHQAEAFLLEVLTAGYTPAEIEVALRIALDRWRALAAEPPSPPKRILRFVGSHDPGVSLIAARFADFAAESALQITFAGSLGGLIALAEGKADLAGSHLWDEGSDSYNADFVQRLLPGRSVALLTLAHRRLGLIVPAGNPAGVAGLADLARPDLRFINRQRGAGTRVWLDAHLRQAGIDPGQIAGYSDEVETHSEVARAISGGRANVGLGIEVAALAYGLDFVQLARERYDLVIPRGVWETAPVQALARWLATADARSAITGLGGYDTAETGRVRWVG